MSNLDILTPKGQKSKEQEAVLLKSFSAASGLQIIETHKDKPCVVDGLMVKDGVIKGVFEAKCRMMTRSEMHGFNNQWLVTFDKILGGMNLAKSLHVPFYGLLYLVNEPVGIMVKISDASGEPLVKMEIQRTVTQRTINGGTANRVNAFIDLSDSKEFPILI